MAATNRISSLSLRIVPLVAVLLGAPALARDDVQYPVNPYHEKFSWERQTENPQRSTQPLPDYEWQEYPSGPNGPRVVKVVVRHDDLRNADNRLLDRVLTNEREAARHLRQAEDAIHDLSMRLRWLDPLRHDSIEQYQAWVDLVDEINRFESYAAETRDYLESCRAFREDVRQRLSAPQPTVVVWNVRNHRNRDYVPTDYLQRKAIEYVATHPEEVGTTIRMGF